jgi:hypothetical protein
MSASGLATHLMVNLLCYVCLHKSAINNAVVVARQICESTKASGSEPIAMRKLKNIGGVVNGYVNREWKILKIIEPTFCKGVGLSIKQKSLCKALVLRIFYK